MSLQFKLGLDQLVKSSGLMDFPGFRLRAYQRGQEILNYSKGKVYDFYDLASLTKIIFTTTYYMDAVSKKKLKLFQSVQELLPWYPYSQVKVGDLLSHSAGNTWWQPFYKKIDLSLNSDQRYQMLEGLVQKVPRSRSLKATYSDIDFFILGSLMQALEKRPLYLIWLDLKDKYFDHTDFHFNPLDRKPLYLRSRYAPTEDCSWRKKVLQAEVHDENAWALGGVGPHAGLFGTLDDLSDYGLWLRSLQMSGKGYGAISKGVAQKFISRSLPSQRGDWGYGFMLPSKLNSSSGSLFSPKSFGHTGFTGISMWLDPKRDLLVCLLSNRIHPTRGQQGFVRLRPLLHDWIVQFIEEKK